MAKQNPVTVEIETNGKVESATFLPGEIERVTFKDEGDFGGGTAGPVTLYAPGAKGGLRDFGKTLPGEYPLKGWLTRAKARKLATALEARFVDGFEDDEGEDEF